MREFVRMGAEAVSEGGAGQEVTPVEDAVAEKFGHGVRGGGDEEGGKRTVPIGDGCSLHLRLLHCLKKKKKR